MGSGSRRSWAGRLSGGDGWVIKAAGFHLLTRALTLSALLVGSRVAKQSLPATLTRWDGKYYESIASGGYPHTLPTDVAGRVVPNAAAFFPVFPYGVRALMTTGLPFWVAAVLLNLLLSTAAAVLIGLVAQRYLDRPAALLTSCLWSVFPTASVLSVPYTEAIFSALAAGTLLAALHARWSLVGALGFLCACSRPTGVVVVGALGILGLVELVRRRDWRPGAAAVVAGSGTVVALLFVGQAVGRWDGWFATEREGWRLRFDGGLSFGRWVAGSALGQPTVFKVCFAVGVVLVLCLAVAAVFLRPPVVVSSYVLLGVVAAVGQGGQQYLAQLRYALPLFPLLVPAALLLLRLPPLARASVLVLLAVGSSAIGLYYFAIGSSAP